MRTPNDCCWSAYGWCACHSRTASCGGTYSTTLVNDSALFVPVVANAVYLFESFIQYIGGTQGSSDLKMMWAVPTGSSMSWTPMYVNTSGTLVAAGANGQGATIIAGTSGNRTISGFGTLAVGSLAGNMQLQWAQNTPSTTATQVIAGSLLTSWQVQ
jgi:uncharacterized protein YgiB involved in biofilm formation